MQLIASLFKCYHPGFAHVNDDNYTTTDMDVCQLFIIYTTTYMFLFTQSASRRFLCKTVVSNIECKSRKIDASCNNKNMQWY